MEQRVVLRDELACGLQHRAGAAMVVLQLNQSNRAEVVLKCLEDTRTRTRPRIHRLLVISDGKEVAMIDRQSPHDRVLDLVEILELVDQDFVPARPHLLRNRIDPEKLGGLQNQRVEVRNVTTNGQLLISLKNLALGPFERLAAKTVAREGVQEKLVPLGRYTQPAQYRSLVVLVGNSESRLQSHFFTELTQQLGAERVDGATLDAVTRVAELGETLRDLAGGFVGEGENANSTRIDIQSADQVPNALDQAESLACTRPGENQRRPRRREDRRAL